MRAQFINAISFATGGGFTLCLFLSIAHFLRTQEKTAAAPAMLEDLDTVMVALPPPPPPPKAEEKPLLVPEASEAIPLGFAEEPSASPVKIAPSPPNIDQLLPMSAPPTHLVASVTDFDPSFTPKLDLNFDNDHIFQKSEVDKMPLVISRPDPEVPASVLGSNGVRTVVVLFVVDTHGATGKVRILRSSDSPEFDAIVAESIQEWTFSPAIRKGKPVRCMIQQQVKVQMGHRDILSL